MNSNRDDLGPLPSEHPREGTSRWATKELEEFVTSLKEKHSLTSSELIFILSQNLYHWSALILSIERRETSEVKEVPRDTT
jgi:hypothetical protein